MPRAAALLLASSAALILQHAAVLFLHGLFLHPARSTPGGPRRLVKEVKHIEGGPEGDEDKAVMEALDGLPPVKVHCSLLAEEAIHAALWDYRRETSYSD